MLLEKIRLGIGVLRPCNIWGHISTGPDVCLLSFYVLATSNVISGWAPTSDSAHSWRLHSAAPLGNQTASTMTRYPIQSHYPDTWQTSLFPILLMLSTWLGGSYKHQFEVFDLNHLETEFPNSKYPIHDACALPVRLLQLCTWIPVSLTKMAQLMDIRCRRRSASL